MSRDWVGYGALGVVTGFLVDFVAMGGDTLIAVAVWLLSDINVIVTLLAQLQVLASGPIEWLDPQTVQKLYYAAVALFLVVLVYRLVNSYQKRGSK